VKREGIEIERKKPLKLYMVFHLNIAYSSIEENLRPRVVEQCYWPLLKLAGRHGLPVGIEAPGFTLEKVRDIDPAWAGELRTLVTNGPCEFIGSGYAQLIGPLVPPEINSANLKLGMKLYEEILGIRPEVAYVNEQAFSSGLIEHYLDAGYKTIIMEWENPHSEHREWNREWRYYAQIVKSQEGLKIPLVWNSSISFQKLQRYVHGEIEMEEYINYLASQCSTKERFFPIYGNDIEIFDFRPGRFHTEAELRYKEWERLDNLFGQLKDDDRFEFVTPTEVARAKHAPLSHNVLSLEIAQQPVLVKKQEKYNINRWAVTGRNSLFANTMCNRILRAMLQKGVKDEDEWRNLCYLWSSDFRTHITDIRWKQYLKELGATADRYAGSFDSNAIKMPLGEGRRLNPGEHTNSVRNNGSLELETKKFKMKLNKQRGLTIEELRIKTHPEKPVLGTIKHGYYDHIRYGADFYSGHVVLESPGVPKVTDLAPADTMLAENDEFVSVIGKVKSALGPIKKTIALPKNEDFFLLDYKMDWTQMPLGSLRLGFVTLIPEAFDKNSLHYSTHNGGRNLERFDLKGSEVEHGRPVSFLVSASNGMGITGDTMSIGDDKSEIEITVDRTISSPLAMIAYQEIDNSFFCRVCFSLREMDDTTRPITEADQLAVYALRLKIRPSRIS